MKPLSDITNGLIGQPMFKILVKAKALERKGRSLYHFEIGDADFRAHEFIIDATKEALDKDKTHYVDSMGILELREAICEYTKKTLGFLPDIKQVLVMPANAVIDFAIRCVANPGEEVIFPDPGFPTYAAVTNYTGVKKIGIPLKEENSFQMDPDDVESRLTSRTRLIIINSPQNPTGSVMSDDEIVRIAKIAEENDIFLLSDEVYSRVIYDRDYFSPSILDQCNERTIILNGFSKGYAMPGWRLGFAIGPEKVIQKMGLLFETIFSCTPPFIQYSGICAIKDNQEIIEGRIREYRSARDLMVTRLNEINGISCLKPNGAIYAFPNIKNTGMNSEEFAEFVLENAGVVTVPGNCFGTFGEGYVRFCFAKSLKMIEDSFKRLKSIF